MPSRDLRRYLRERKIALGEKDMLKLIDDYAYDFSQKLELFDIAAEVFAEKPNKRHAAALAAHYRRIYAEFMNVDGGEVYAIEIECEPNDKDGPYITRTFDDALALIRAYLKKYKRILAESKHTLYHIVKHSTRAPSRPSDIDGAVGCLGECTLGKGLKILDVSVYKLGNEFNSRCARISDCDNCKRVCLAQYEPDYPPFLEKYDLVEVADYYRGRAPEYGVLFCDVRESPNDSYVIMLDDDRIKARDADGCDEYGYYKILYAHEHPAYARLSKPDIATLPRELVRDYEYAVGVLKEVERDCAAGTTEAADGKAVEMRLDAVPFEQIKSGKKTVELRLYDEKRRALGTGDTVIFRRTDGDGELRAQVVSLDVRKSFADLFALPDMLVASGFDECAPAQAVSCMRAYYSADDENKYGVVAIGLRLL